MPTTHTVDAKMGVVYSWAWDVLTDDDLVAHCSALHQDPDFSPALAQVYDLSWVTDIHVTLAGVRGLAERAPFSATTRRAVVTNGELTRGFASMYALTNDGPPGTLEMFRDRDSAIRWLGVSRDDAIACLAGGGSANA